MKMVGVYGVENEFSVLWLRVLYEGIGGVFSVFQVMNKMKMMNDDGSERLRRMQVGGIGFRGGQKEVSLEGDLVCEERRCSLCLSWRGCL